MSYWSRRTSGRAGAPAIPLYIRSLGVVRWVTPAQYRLFTLVQDGRWRQQREIAAATGYSVMGVNRALRSFHAMGLGTFESKRGRHGRTRFVINADASRAFVRTHVRLLLSPNGERFTSSTTVVETRPWVRTFAAPRLLDAWVTVEVAA